MYELIDPSGAFDRSLGQVAGILAELAHPLADTASHDELEDWLAGAGRELMRSLLQDHLDLRAVREVRRDDVVGCGEDRPRSRVESGHERGLTTVFGAVRVRRLAYRALAASNLCPADVGLNLPEREHSHGLRRLAAIEATRGSFEQAQAAICRATGVTVGKRQIEALAVAAAADVDAFWTVRRPGRGREADALVLTFDGKGIVMRPDSLRPDTAKAAAKASTKLATRLSRGEKRNRKRMAEIACVYDAAPAVRTSADIMASRQAPQAAPPKATGKWLFASVRDAPAAVIAAGFDEAARRDPEHRRPWIVLIDGHYQQLRLVRAEAARRQVKVTIICDFIHVLEYLWRAGWCFFTEGDTAIEDWIATQARRVLEGKAGIAAAAIRRKATARHLEPAQRRGADITANYLLKLRPQLRYDTALAAGWPIATGVIEGAVRHLVKDRMDITGARWGLTGAEAILKLRTLTTNGDFADYWHYHLQQEQHRTHHNRYRDHLALAA
nr:ISKra4 family transposase [Catenulispora pinisilvae]